MSACEKLLKSDGGKVLLFSSTICSKGLGQLKSRENPKDFNTDNEKFLFSHTKEHNFYTNLGS